MANRIIKIFMERDGLTEEEARKEFHSLRGDMFGCCEEAEDLLADYGLEPDYLDDLLF